jgi:hypothetical protein
MKTFCCDPAKRNTKFSVKSQIVLIFRSRRVLASLNSAPCEGSSQRLQRYSFLSCCKDLTANESFFRIVFKSKLFFKLEQFVTSKTKIRLHFFLAVVLDILSVRFRGFNATELRKVATTTQQNCANDDVQGQVLDGHRKAQEPTFARELEVSKLCRFIRSLSPPVHCRFLGSLKFERFQVLLVPRSRTLMLLFIYWTTRKWRHKIPNWLLLGKITTFRRLMSWVTEIMLVYILNNQLGSYIPIFPRFNLFQVIAFRFNAISHLFSNDYLSPDVTAFRIPSSSSNTWT